VRGARGKPYSRLAGGTTGWGPGRHGAARDGRGAADTSVRGAEGRERPCGAWGHSHASMRQRSPAPGSAPARSSEPRRRRPHCGTREPPLHDRRARTRCLGAPGTEAPSGRWGVLPKGAYLERSRRASRGKPAPDPILRRRDDDCGRMPDGSSPGAGRSAPSARDRRSEAGRIWGGLVTARRRSGPGPLRFRAPHAADLAIAAGNWCRMSLPRSVVRLR
jgi:hypothetical protein